MGPEQYYTKIQENDLIVLKKIERLYFLQKKQLVVTQQFTMINNPYSALSTQAAGESQCYAFWSFLLVPALAPFTL